MNKTKTSTSQNCKLQTVRHHFYIYAHQRYQCILCQKMKVLKI